MRLRTFKHTFILCFVLSCLALGGVQHGRAADAQHAPVVAANSQQLAEQQLRAGLEFEQNRQWLEAVQHYEKACRATPDHAELKRRLLISRIHYDVVRRCQDPSLLDAMATISSSDGLELYSEVLSRLEMSYVDKLEMTELVRGGTAYLEVALTEPLFVSHFLRGQDPARIEQFRTNVHRITLARQVRSRFEARSIVANVATIAQEQIGLPASATIIQFVCGAVGLLDPYSSFLSSGELAEVESQIEGNFVGLGIALQPHEVPLRILSVIPGGPALESGLKAGDRILEVGSVRCSDVGAERAADLLRGPEHSKVRLLMEREGRGQFELFVDRRRVEVASVENAHIINDENGAGYLKINSFQKTTVNELDAALFELERQHMRSLIIDLRGNPGGWLDAAVAVADRFIGEGIIVSTRGKNGIENQNYTAVRGGTWQMPLVVLIDGDSASASEIFAGAIRDHQRGLLVGTTSYGKGSVQGLFHTKAFPGGVRLTVSKFYSPSGTAISDRGVAPHVPVESQQLAAKPELSVPSERSVLSQTYTAAKPELADAASADGQPHDVALEIAIARAATPRYTSQMNRN